MSEVVFMNKIIPITDLRKTNEISSLCSKEDQPVFVTKNGYSDLVIMSQKVYERLERRVTVESPLLQNKLEIKEQDECMGFIKVAACNFDVAIHNVKKNVSSITSRVNEAYNEGAKIIVFP